MSPFELGLSLITGRASKAWNTRAIRARALIAGAVGGGAPTADSEPPSPLSGQPALHMKTAALDRAGAIEAARAVVDSFGARRFDRLGDLLSATVWVLWPNGAVLGHPRAALLHELARREGERLPIRIADPKSYTYSELRTALARGIAEGLDAVLGLTGSTLVTFMVSGARGPPGRVLLVMQLEEGSWRARTLPLGGPDDAHTLSVRLRDLDRPEAVALHPLVRAIVLGHGGLVRASFQHMMPRVWVRDQLVEAEQVAIMADDGPARLGSTEVVFGRAREVELKALNKMAPKPGLAKLEARAFEDFGQSFDALSPRLLCVELSASWIQRPESSRRPLPRTA